MLNTVGSIVRKWKTTGSNTKNLLRWGWPHKLNDANAHYIARKEKKESFLIRSEVHKGLRNFKKQALI